MRKMRITGLRPAVAVAAALAVLLSLPPPAAAQSDREEPARDPWEIVFGNRVRTPEGERQRPASGSWDAVFGGAPPPAAEPGREAEEPPETGAPGPPGTLAELLSLPPGGAIGLWALAAPFRLPPGSGSSADRVAVPVLVEIDGPSLIAGTVGEKIPTEIHAYAFDLAGSVAGSFRVLLAFDSDRQRRRIADSGVKFYGRLDLPPGSYDLRILVRNAATSAQAVAALPLDVPAFETAGTVVLPPLIPEPPNRWMMVFQDRPPGDREVPYPFVRSAGDAFVPAARPVLPAGQTVEVALFAYNLDPAAVSLDAQILDAGGYVVLGQQLPVSERLPAAEDRPERLLSVLELAGVPAGEYTLSIGLAESAAGRRHQVSIPIRVQSRESYLAGQRPETPEETRSRSKQLRDLAAGYREVLAALSSGQGERAVGSLTGFESAEGARRGESDVQLLMLRKAEVGVARELAERQPTALIPLLKLHYDAYLLYLDRRQMLLARHSRTMVEELAAYYEQIGVPPAARQLAARALTSLGGVLQQSGATGPGNAMFQRALALDPGNEAALLGLAAFYEKTGRYGDAARYLERLVSTHPRNAEGWLRYGVNLCRVDRCPEGRKWLRRAMGTKAPPWVRALAYQELAGEAIGGGRLEVAETLLHQGVEALPGEQGLYLQLAHVLDRRGRRGEANVLLTRVASLAATTPESPRYLYNRWPTKVIERGLRQLTNNATESLPTLAQAIGSSRGGTGGRR